MEEGGPFMPTPAILFYTPSPVPYASKLFQLCAVQGIKLRAVETSDLDCPLSSLAQGGQGTDPLPVREALPEPVLVFCHLSDRQLDQALLALRKLKAFCLKAVLTPTNSQWTLGMLYQELVKERAQLSGGHLPKG